MRLPRIIRHIGKQVVKASPILRRHILPSSDYRLLSGQDEARRISAATRSSSSTSVTGCAGFARKASTRAP